jgi:hypothetical protein
MSTPREELHALIDSLPDSAAADLLPELRLLKLQMESGAGAEPAQGTGEWPPAWFGAIEGSTPDLSERIDEILGAELGRGSA